MKKSTLLYIGLHVGILLIPYLLLSAVRYKIATGDIIDTKARQAAAYTIKSFSDIHEIEVSSSDSEHDLILKINIIDSVNTIEMDTSTAKYVSYAVVGDKLVLHYDYLKDSLDNLKTPEELEEESRLYAAEERNYRSVTLYLKSNLTKLTAIKSHVTIDMDNDEKLINDLEIHCQRSYVNVLAPYLVKRNAETGEEEDIPYTFNHHLTLHLLDYSDAQLQYFGYIEKFDLELKDESKFAEHIPTGAFNLAIDKQSTYMMDVNDLDQVKIKYE
jgi:hypothetical protein